MFVLSTILKTEAGTGWKTSFWACFEIPMKNKRISLSRYQSEGQAPEIWNDSKSFHQ
jgi:hypothetical protein